MFPPSDTAQPVWASTNKIDLMFSLAPLLCVTQFEPPSDVCKIVPFSPEIQPFRESVNEIAKRLSVPATGFVDASPELVWTGGAACASGTNERNPEGAIDAFDFRGGACWYGEFCSISAFCNSLNVRCPGRPSAGNPRCRWNATIAWLSASLGRPSTGPLYSPSICNPFWSCRRFSEGAEVYGVCGWGAAGIGGRIHLCRVHVIPPSAECTIKPPGPAAQICFRSLSA